jgi:hypothetical protein
MSKSVRTRPSLANELTSCLELLASGQVAQATKALEQQFLAFCNDETPMDEVVRRMKLQRSKSRRDSQLTLCAVALHLFCVAWRDKSAEIEADVDLLTHAAFSYGVETEADVSHLAEIALAGCGSSDLQLFQGFCLIMAERFLDKRNGLDALNWLQRIPPEQIDLLLRPKYESLMDELHKVEHLSRSAVRKTGTGRKKADRPGK